MTINLNIKVNYIVALYSMAVQNVNIIIYSALIKSLNYWDNKSLLNDELENQQYLKDLFAVMEKRVPAAHCQATMTLNCK